METKELILPDGWEVKEVQGNKIIVGEKEIAFPKTWQECNKGVGMSYYPSIGWYVPNDNETAIKALCKLLICRNAWWKVLKWKPDWKNKNQHKFCIYVMNDEKVTGICHNENTILAFPEGDIRDQFLESFRNLIEEAKELL